MEDLVAIIWDFDGTLVDTREKNLAVTRTLVGRVTGRSPLEIPALASRDGYDAALHRHQHWQDFYRQELGLGEEELMAAAGMWMEAQAADSTHAPCFEGLPALLDCFDHLPHGIVSLNARDNIARIIAELELAPHFDEILGFESVPLERRKPQPDALLICIERLDLKTEGTVVYVGDHETDTVCATRADRALSDAGLSTRVLSIAADFTGADTVSRWEARPDHVATSIDELGAILGGPVNG